MRPRGSDNDFDVLLAGGGHAHLLVLRDATVFREAGYRVALLDPGPFWYSGMASGMLGGAYEPTMLTVDLERLCRHHGVHYLPHRLLRVDPEHRRVYTEGGAGFSYGVLSLNLGSHVALPAQSADQTTYTAKPLTRLWKLRSALEAEWQANPQAEPQVVVVGGGVTGCELAANLLALARRREKSLGLRLYTRTARLLPGQAKGAACYMHRYLVARGAEIHTATDVSPEGQGLPDCDFLLWATGLGFAPPAPDFGLPHSARGIPVEATLAVRGVSGIFVAGDCMDFSPAPLPKLGVFGVRSAPILKHNLLASLDDRPLRSYHPQKRYLSILNLGAGQGLALWGSYWWAGRSAMWLKHYLDTRFLRPFQLPAPDLD